MKTIKNIVLSFLALAFVTSNAFALGSEEVIVREYNKTSNAEYKDYNDATLLNIKYTGSEADSEVNVTSHILSIEFPVGTVEYSLDLTSTIYDTAGELCDYIEGRTDLECVLTGGKRDDTTKLIFDPISAESLSGAAGYSAPFGIDNTVTDTYAYINRIGITPASGKRVVLKYCNVQNDGTGTLTVYGKLRKFEGVSDGVTRNDATLIASMATANDTSEVDGNIYGGNWIEFAKDAHVVVSAGNASTEQTSTSFLECYWDEK